MGKVTSIWLVEWLCWGVYVDAADEALCRLLASTVSEFHGQFPGDLHFSQSKIGRVEMSKLCKTLSASLVDWLGNQRQLFAVAIQHKQDVFTHGPEILVEREQDNRYLLMLCELVEYLCYVDPTIRARLRPNAQVYIYVAQRYFCVGRSPKNRELLEALGYEFLEVADLPNYYLVKSITRRELRGLIRAAVKDRWPKSQLQFRKFGVVKLQYGPAKQPTKPAALYLADVALGCLRRQCQGDAWAVPALTVVLLDYSPLLHRLINMESALANGNLVGFLDHARQFWHHACAEWVDLDSSVRQVLTVQKRAAAQLVGQDTEPLVRFLRTACAIADQPGRAFSGIRLADFGIEILRQAGQVPIDAEVLALQAQLSGANHLGERQVADACWDAYIEREPQLVTLGLRGLELMVEMRNRRAVSRMDQFCFDEAKITLAYVLSKVEKSLDPLAEMFGIAAKDVPTRLMGALYGSLGQAFALQTKPDHGRAEECFRKALSLFTAPEDQEQQWVYLGHLACDRAGDGRHLWSEVCEHLPRLSSLAPILEPAKQYQLALQIKGLFVFRPLEDVAAFLTEWAKTDLSEAYSEENLASHPFGLIYQGIAMLYQRYWRETGEQSHARQALEWLGRAAQHMAAGGPVLQVLSRVAKLRRCLLESELPNSGAHAERRLAELFQGLRGYLAEHFGESAWAEGPEGRGTGHFGQFDPGPNHSWCERASAVLAAVHFNYW